MLQYMQMRLASTPSPGVTYSLMRLALDVEMFSKMVAFHQNDVGSRLDDV